MKKTTKKEVAPTEARITDTVKQETAQEQVQRIASENQVLLSYLTVYYNNQVKLQEYTTPLEGKKINLLNLWKYRKEIIALVEAVITIIKELKEKIKVNRVDD